MKALIYSIYFIGFISIAQNDQTIIWNTNQEGGNLDYDTNLIIKSTTNVTFIGEIYA